MTTTIYGIRNCDTMKKARAWLDAHGVDYRFHDYKALGIDRSRIESWADHAGWEKIINRAGMTFRKLPDADKTDLTRDRAIDLMVAQPSMIRRPVVDHDGDLLIGFDDDRYAAAVG